MRAHLPSLLTVFCAAALAATPDRAELQRQAGVPEGYVGALPSLAAVNIRDAQLDLVLEGLQRPWAFEFIDEHTLLISETGGRLLLHRLQDAQTTAIENLPAIAADQEQTGLLDVALHPRFEQNQLIYFSYSEADPAAPAYYRTVVARARLDGHRLEDLQTVLAANPFGWSPSNFGGALAFDAAGYLYVSIGDRSEHDLAQRGDRLQGKILRLHDDGRAPADNPFVDDPQIDDRIYALGVRNPQGLDFDRHSGRLYEAEHGPLGGDEINRIDAGANYGWPTIGYGRSYAMEKLGVGTHAAGMRQPLYYYLPSIATSPLLVYRGTMFAEWDGDLLVGALKGQHLSWVDLDGDRVRSQQAILGELNDRVRDIKSAADGSIWILTQNRGLFRLHRPPQSEDAPAPVDPAVIYGLVCSGCHDHGAYQAPNPAVAEQWQAILEQPLADTYRHTIEGKGNMPARGLCEICTDQHLRDTVDWMLQRVRGDAATR